MTAHVLQLDLAGYVNGAGRSFDVRTRNGAFAGVISESFKTNKCTIYWNDACTRGSARKFDSIQKAAEFIINRRVNKGYRF